MSSSHSTHEIPAHDQNEAATADSGHFSMFRRGRLRIRAAVRTSDHRTPIDPRSGPRAELPEGPAPGREPPPPYTAAPRAPITQHSSHGSSRQEDSRSSLSGEPSAVRNAVARGPHLPPPYCLYPQEPPPPQPEGRIPSRVVQLNKVLTIEEEDKILAQVLAAYPWRHLWGPRPRNLAGALNRAALLGNRKLLLAFLSAGAVIKSNEHAAVRSSTAVHEALRGPRPELALLLLDHVASASYRGSPRGSATDESQAQSQARRQVASVLASRDEQGCTPLHIAAEVGEVGLITALVYRGAGVDLPDQHKRTPLHMAARYGRREAMRCLLDLGADPSKIHKGLWTQLGALTTEELGSYGLISDALASVLHEAEGESLGVFDGFTSRLGQREGVGDAGDATSPPPSIDPYQLAWPTSQEQEQEQAHPRSVAVGECSPDGEFPTSLRKEDVAFLAAAGIAWGQDTQSLLEALRSLRVPRRHSRAGSLVHTEEYASWLSACESVRAEHLAQRQRNFETGGGTGFVNLKIRNC